MKQQIRYIELKTHNQRQFSTVRRNAMTTQNEIINFTKKIKMKKTILLFAFIATTLVSFGQTKDQELSNAEKFSAKAGSLI